MNKSTFGLSSALRQESFPDVEDDGSSLERPLTHRLRVCCRVPKLLLALSVSMWTHLTCVYIRTYIASCRPATSSSEAGLSGWARGTSDYWCKRLLHQRASVPPICDRRFTAGGAAFGSVHEGPGFSGVSGSGPLS